jgi:hypothetical protein
VSNIPTVPTVSPLVTTHHSAFIALGFPRVIIDTSCHCHRADFAPQPSPQFDRTRREGSRPRSSHSNYAAAMSLPALISVLEWGSTTSKSRVTQMDQCNASTNDLVLSPVQNSSP